MKRTAARKRADESANGARRSSTGADGDLDVSREDLEQLLAALQAARDGDFQLRLPARGRGLGAALKRAFNELAGRRELLGQEDARVGRVIGREGRLTESGKT